MRGTESRSDPSMKKSRRQPDRLTKAWIEALTALSGQNTPLEIVPISERGEAMPQARLRLLAQTDDGGLVIERPRGAGPASALREGVEVGVYVIHGTQRMKARSRVVEVAPYALNDQVMVPAATLEPPRDVSSAQRRECYRLPTGHLDLPPVRLTPLVEVPNFEGWDARMLDLSDRGIGLALPIAAERALTLIDRSVNLAVHLEDGVAPLRVKARAVRVFADPAGKACLGMLFEHDAMAEQRAAQRAIQAFSMEQQRRELRRIRGTG